MAVNTRSADLMGWCAFLLGIGVVVFAIAVTCHSYIPCPFWDEWVVVADIGSGKGPTHLAWLWSQQNEHRLAIPRLLVWLDLVAFHGRNVSLFIEILGVQVLHWAALCFVVERFTRAPVSVKRSIQGLFGFCLFHPNQLENFTWAFQIGFVLPFALATLALILMAFFSRWRRPVLAVIIAGGMPILAALNLAGGLVIGPVVVGIAWCKRTRAWVGAMLTAIWFASAAGYLYGYHRAGTDLPPCAAILQGRKLFLYVLTYFGASWTRLLPHKERLIALASILIFAAILGRALRRRRGGVSDLEWLLLGECGLTIAIALLTAFGRIQFGEGQAFAGRYQTPAMIYWAALGSLLLLLAYEKRPSRFHVVQAMLLGGMLASVLTFPGIWGSTTARADELRIACRAVMGPQFDVHAASKLYENTTVVKEGREFLRRKWRTARK